MAWDRFLIAEPEGPSFISRTVAHAVWTGDARDTRPEPDKGDSQRKFGLVHGESQGRRMRRPLNLLGAALLMNFDRSNACFFCAQSGTILAI